MSTISSIINIEDIKKNSNNFDFIDTLGSFINNIKFKNGFDNYQNNQRNQYSYIWNVLSAIGDDYAETIYENVLNYIDNVSNVDLCKIRALQSMIQIVGIKYDVLASFDRIPIEIANLMDILSINKSYLLQSDKFNQTFIDQLSSFGCIKHVVETNINALSNNMLSTSTAQLYPEYIDSEKYEEFLYTIYYIILRNYVYLQYADAENNLPSDKQYIYQYIQHDLMQNSSQPAVTSEYNRRMTELKLKYGLLNDFDQQTIVDNIENGYDSINNYNVYEQLLLKEEILYREQTYSSIKKYNNQIEKFLGYNLTRYSYYREKKVREYFSYIENECNNLILTDGIQSAITNNTGVVIKQYDKDHNYFDISQTNHETLLVEENNQLIIQESMISKMAKALAEQTIQISYIRDQIKTQMRKSYMRGTFLLISYVINEFLKYGIAQKYGKDYSTREGVALDTIIETAINNDCTQLIEYYDSTDYFNITTNNDISALNSETTAEKFWDNFYDKIGRNTKDIPLNQIEDFYLNQLKLKNNNIDDVVNFLSVIYEYGANDSFINKITQEFTCKLNDGRLIGDPINEIDRLNSEILSIDTITDAINTYVERGYQQQVTTIEEQLSDLTCFVSSYYWSEISNANDSFKEEITSQYDKLLDDAHTIGDALIDISSSYESLKNNPKYYKYYISSYNEPVNPPPFFIEKLQTFSNSCDVCINWQFSQLKHNLDDILTEYRGLSSDLYNQLFALSVWQHINSPIQMDYWPYYSPNYDDELTTVTNALKDYLISQVYINNDQALQHLQNHYDKLLSYKEDVSRIIDDCNNALAKLEAYKAAVEVATGIPNDSDQTRTFCMWDTVMYKKQADIDNGKYKEDFDGIELTKYEPNVTYYDEDAEFAWIVKSYRYHSPAITGTIDEQLYAIDKRCNYPHYPIVDRRDALIGEGEGGVGIYYDAIGGWATSLTQKVEIFKNDDVYYDDDGNPKKDPGADQFEFWYDSPEYEKEPRYYINGNIVEYKWKDNYSETNATEIRTALSNAMVNLDAVVDSINAELDCLGINSTIINSATTIDDILDEAKDVYADLVDYINDNVYPYLQKGSESDGWQSIANEHNDINLIPFKYRLDRINAINLSNSVKYNISYINTTFNSINLSIQQLLNNESLYFENYSHNNADRLDQQIVSISNYMNKRDDESRLEVLNEISSISAKYNEQLLEFNQLKPTLVRHDILYVNDDYSYNVQYQLYDNEIYQHISSNSTQYAPIERYKDCLDYLLSGDYLSYPQEHETNGILKWIEICAYNGFEETAISAINKKIPELPEYQNMMNLIDISRMKYLYNELSTEILLLDKFDEIKNKLNSDIDYISVQMPHYYAQKEIYLKYNGTSIGYDPFYNHKNLAYSSYQIHPYLYNFVEKSNIIYPLANNFFVTFDEQYENNLYKKTIDDIIGKYGNVKDLWKHGMFDWTSYQSLYEVKASQFNNKNPLIGYTGLFYPPAVQAFIDDPETFMQDVQDNVISSYYYHLNLNVDSCNRIVEQLTSYYGAIKALTQLGNSVNKSLSNEYDIYKFAEDANGNQLFLLKSYQYLYNLHSNDPTYQPSYNEKKNTLGEVWMRIKNHPIAFPAFDIRPGCELISQYNINENINSNGKKINGYLFSINEYISNYCSDEVKDYCKDLLSRYNDWGGEQYLRCFFDFELDAHQRSLLLVVPYKTGTNHKTIMHTVENGIKHISKFKYANSSIILGLLDYGGLNLKGEQVFNFCADSNINNNINVDNIYNKYMLLPSSTFSTYTEFVGFAKTDAYIYAIFVEKHGIIETNYNFNPYHSFKITVKTNSAGNIQLPYLTLQYAMYKVQSQPKYYSTSSQPLKYDIYDAARDPNIHKNDRALYENASNVVLTYNNTGVTLGFITERISPNVKNNYISSSTIVNFSEYSTMMEGYTVEDESGINKNYPASTALIQTQDSDHINIYNSFDSFVQHLVNVTFTFTVNKLNYKNTSYFNLNSDLGYLPQYPDTFGKSNLYANPALKNKTEYAIELLGPEKSDIAFTPIITDNTDEKYGRVVENYKEYNKIYGYSPQLLINNNTKDIIYTFELSNIFPIDDWESLMETNDLLRYKYILYNTNYESQPILKGELSSSIPTGYYYQHEEKYDLLSGEDLVGPNQTAYQNAGMTNHIDNISQISTSVIFDNNTLLPTCINLSCTVRHIVDRIQIIPENTFRLFIYAKNNTKSYEYYHLFENASVSAISNTITYNEELLIDFDEISSISTYTLPNSDKKPFENKAFNETNPRKLSAMLEFKYSEQENINREFPYLDASDVQDEITVVQNDTQSIYYVSLDNNDTILRNTVNVTTYNTVEGKYYNRTINTALPKYNTFYDNALRLEISYNMEKINNLNDEYEVVLYFNYKNFTNPSYVKYIKNNNNPPSATIYNSNDDDIKTTYLILRPGQHGVLDIRVDYLIYGLLDEQSISEQILGHSYEILKRYYIMNVSDNKPKFIISREPFKSLDTYDDTDNYELEDVYYAGMTFRYIRFIIYDNRSNYAESSLSRRIAIGKLKFVSNDGSEFEYPSKTTAQIIGGNIIEPNNPLRMISKNNKEYFSASNINFSASPLIIEFDLHSQILDIDMYSIWQWYNSPHSNSHSGYIPKKFSIAFSNDRYHWYKCDEFNDTTLSIPTRNLAKAYENKLNPNKYN